MITRKQRLSLRDNPGFFSQARRWYGTYLTLFYDGEAGLSQGTVVVPKKVSLKATKRNKIKRQLRNLLNKKLITNKNLRVVAVAKTSILKTSYNDISQEIEKAFVSIIEKR